MTFSTLAVFLNMRLENILALLFGKTVQKGLCAYKLNIAGVLLQEDKNRPKSLETILLHMLGLASFHKS